MTDYILAGIVLIAVSGFFWGGILGLKTLVKSKVRRQVVTVAMLFTVVVITSYYIGKSIYTSINIVVSVMLFVALVGAMIMSIGDF